FYLFITEDINSENPVEESYWVEAAEMADSLGVDVINSSLGYFGYDNPAYSYSYSDMTGNKAFASKGANIAFLKGMIVVCSAGNSGGSSEPFVGVPAEATNVIAVGAVKFDRTLASFSSIGPSFDGRVKPDVMAQGQSSVVASTSGAITTANGTSFSSPIMAGMITSFWQALPNATNVEILQFVKQASDRFTNPTAQFGYGIPNFQLALNNALSINTPVNATETTFSIVPNPCNNEITINFSSLIKNASIKIYSVLGKEIYAMENIAPQSKIDLTALQSGIYFYKMKISDGEISGKLLKN
ncbi:MAG: S8 family peptidase, partial [Flavobacterium sp.]|nr:S8 family peptidase [Flavobacterium sp.]